MTNIVANVVVLNMGGVDMKELDFTRLNYEKSLRVQAKTNEPNRPTDWVDGYIIRYGYTGKEEYYIVPYYASTLYTFKIDPNTICKCAGILKDRLFYENDIYIDPEEMDIFHVRYDLEQAAFVLDVYNISGMMMEYGWDETAGGFKQCDTLMFDDFTSLSHLEWIGNSVDNPGYLEGEYIYE